MDIGQAIDDRAKQKIDNINATCAEIYKLAVDVLDISKLEDGEMVVEKRTIDGTVLYSVLQRCIDTLPFEEKGQCVHIDQNVEGFCIFADNRLLERVLYNLLSNAHKYTPDNGSIEIRCKRSGNENGISVYNSGMPLSNDKTKRIFEKYYGVGINYSRHSTGLGLYFCKLVMHAHRGSIQVEPVSDGNWFHLRFPGRE
jgi:K+-sensing histidine kinase KdpD